MCFSLVGELSEHGMRTAMPRSFACGVPCKLGQTM